MREKSKKRMIESYNKSIAEHGDTALGMQYDNEEIIPIRYYVHQQIGIVPGRSVLDVGCGYGDFYGYLRSVGIDADYTGYDINEQMIEIARRWYPEAQFHVTDIEEEDTEEEFDYVVACGLLNNKTPDHIKWVTGMLFKMYELATIGVAVDFKSTHFHCMTEGAFYANPAEMLQHVMHYITKRVVLRHDYATHEFTLYIYHQQEREGKE